MALASTAFMAAPGLWNSSAQLDKLDVSDVLAAILLKDTATLGQIAMEGVVENIETFWFEDGLAPMIISGCFMSQEAPSSLGGSYIGFTASVNTTARMAKAMPAGTIFKPEGIPTLFIAMATASTSLTASVYSSTTLTGSAYLTTSLWVDGSASAALWQRFFIVAKPHPDTSVHSDDVSLARTRRRNFTQVFERAIEITETRENIALYAVPDELKLQIKYRTYELKRELNNSVINGVAQLNAGIYSPNTETRTMAGIIQQIRDPDLDFVNEDACVSQAAGGALTITRINDLCKLMFDYGGFDDQSKCIILVGAYQSRVIALLEEGRIRRSSNELIVGSYANAVKTDLGFDLPVVLDRWMPPGTLIILDKSRAKLRPLAGDSWHLTKMAKTGRSQAYQLSGQYTVILENTDSCHGMIQNLAWS
jgi:hypothetical protein